MPRSRRRPRSPGLAHYGAPAALLVAVTVAVLLVHSGLQQGSGGGTTATVVSVPTTTPTAATTTRKRATGSAKRFYTVQSGDTFGTIAAKEGISVAQLQSLNPGVSSNALQVGQKLRVR